MARLFTGPDPIPTLTYFACRPAQGGVGPKDSLGILGTGVRLAELVTGPTVEAPNTEQSHSLLHSNLQAEPLPE